MRKKTHKKYANVLNAIKKYADENHGSMPRAVLESICAEHETTTIILQGALGVGLFEKNRKGIYKIYIPGISTYTWKESCPVYKRKHIKPCQEGEGEGEGAVGIISHPHTGHPTSTDKEREWCWCD